MKSKQLTPKEKIAVKSRLSGKTKRQSILDAYNCKSPIVADVMAQQVFKRERVIDNLLIYRDAEKELLPLAIAQRKKILLTNPKNSPSWAIIDKTATETIRGAIENPDNKIAPSIRFGSGFFKTDVYLKERGEREIKPIEIIEE